MGYATSKSLVEAGAEIAIYDLIEELLNKAGHELHPDSKAVFSRMVKVTDRQAVEPSLQDSQERFGGIDSVANSCRDRETNADRGHVEVVERSIFLMY